VLLKAEDEAVKSRFEKAESLLGERTPSSDSPSNSPPLSPPVGPDIKEQPKKERVIRDSFLLSHLHLLQPMQNNGQIVYSL
jgi:hypothetical protein